MGAGSSVGEQNSVRVIGIDRYRAVFYGRPFDARNYDGIAISSADVEAGTIKGYITYKKNYGSHEYLALWSEQMVR